MIKEIKHLIRFFFKTSNLMKGLKMHRQNPLFRGLLDDIRTHFFEVAVTGYFLAEESGAKNFDNHMLGYIILTYDYQNT